MVCRPEVHVARCELTIVRERSDPTYRAGDPIRGHVLVRVDSSCRCNALTLGPAWRTHGRGNTARGEAKGVELFRGEWTAGEEHAYPFELRAPSWPWTYHGHEVNLDWSLVARADIPWALDPKAEEEIVIAPGGDTTDAEVELERHGRATTAHARFGLCLALIGLSFAMSGLAAMATGVLVVLQGELGGLVAVPFGALFAAVGAGIAFLGVRNDLAQIRLGRIDVSLSARRARPGDVVTCVVRLSPRADVQLNGVTMRLRGCEVAVRGSGTNRTTHTHELHDEQVVVDGSRRSVRRLEDVELEQTFRIPADAPYSFFVPDNSVAWSISVHVDVAGWPDWTHEEPLIVLP